MEHAKLLTFIADFLLDDHEIQPLRGAALRQAVLADPRGELERYGLRPDHIDLLLEHGPNPGVLVAAVRDEIVVAMNEGATGGTTAGGTVAMAPYLWPGDEQPLVVCLVHGSQESPSLILPKGSTDIGIVGVGLSKETRFFFEKAGEESVMQSRPSDEPVEADIEACKDGHQRVHYQFTFTASGVYYLRVRASEGEAVSGLNDRIKVEVQ